MQGHEVAAVIVGPLWGFFHAVLDGGEWASTSSHTGSDTGTAGRSTSHGDYECCGDASKDLTTALFLGKILTNAVHWLVTVSTPSNETTKRIMLCLMFESVICVLCIQQCLWWKYVEIIMYGDFEHKLSRTSIWLNMHSDPMSLWNESSRNWFIMPTMINVNIWLNFRWSFLPIAICILQIGIQDRLTSYNMRARHV